MGSQERSGSPTQSDHSVPRDPLWLLVHQAHLFIQIPKKTCEPFPSIWCYEENDPKTGFDFRSSDFHKNPPHKWGVCFPACRMKKQRLRKLNTSCREHSGQCTFSLSATCPKRMQTFMYFIERCFLRPDSIKEETEWELWSCQTGLLHISPKLTWQKTQPSGLDSRCSWALITTKPMMWIHL